MTLEDLAFPPAAPELLERLQAPGRVAGGGAQTRPVQPQPLDFAEGWGGDQPVEKPEITLVLPYPPSANRYWRHRAMPRGGIQTYVSKDGKQFRESVHWLLRGAGVRKPLQGRIGIAYTLYPNRPQDYRTRMRKLGEAWQDTVQCIDLDNAQKALLDALKGVAFEDDAWVRQIQAVRAEPDGEARIEVSIWKIAAPAPQADLFSGEDA